jgi:hypothetical protein
MVLQNSLNNRNLDIEKEGTLIQELTEILNFNSVVFNVYETAPDSGKVNVEIDTTSLTQTQFNRVDVTTDYSGQTNDFYLAVDTSSNKITITLHTGYEGERLTIKDETGNAKKNRITLNPQVGETILGENEVIMKINYMALQLVYTNGNWRIV